jgi:protein-S-isoprenylcysteine O-methyltransferase Ste14
MAFVREFISKHPQLTAWFALAVGMVLILILVPKNAVLLPREWAALIIATIILAGLCVWIIFWEEGGEEEEEVS